jgi:hypothetical protein
MWSGAVSLLRRSAVLTALQCRLLLVYVRHHLTPQRLSLVDLVEYFWAIDDGSAGFNTD